MVSFRSFRFARCGRFGGFVSLVSLVSVVSFRPFRFVVSGFSTCPILRCLSNTSANSLFLRAHEHPKMQNTLWVGENRKIERGRLQLNIASLLIHGPPLHIHYQVKIVLDEVVNRLPPNNQRRLELGTF